MKAEIIYFVSRGHQTDAPYITQCIVDELFGYFVRDPQEKFDRIFRAMMKFFGYV